uniref:Uncharacterized protein n=1 Tax=Anguilla anguilla TaxID=7936 RepID=A0A0E9V7L4_ANGAN
MCHILQASLPSPWPRSLLLILEI